MRWHSKHSKMGGLLFEALCAVAVLVVVGFLITRMYTHAILWRQEATSYLQAVTIASDVAEKLYGGELATEGGQTQQGPYTVRWKRQHAQQAPISSDHKHARFTGFDIDVTWETAQGKTHSFSVASGALGTQICT